MNAFSRATAGTRPPSRRAWTTPLGETRFKLVTAAVFYRLIGRITAVPIPRDTGGFRLLDRKVVDALTTMRERQRFTRGSVPQAHALHWSQMKGCAAVMPVWNEMPRP